MQQPSPEGALKLPGFFAGFTPQVEAELARQLPTDDEVPPVISRAMHYSVFTGGKRVRPVLALLACDLVCSDSTRALPAGCAVEFMHTYSLIHDDLPCMDDDDLRRGRPTSHRVFGEATAVLAGDALQALAFETLSRTGTGYSPSQVAEMVRSLATAAGARGMVGGQVMDIEAAADDLESIAGLHRKKTGALFRAALELGAIAGEGSPRQMDVLSRYADAFGLAFQITDDILDVVGDPEKTGRYPGSDADGERRTYTSLVGLERARELAREAADRGREALSELNGRTGELEELLRFVLSREG